MGDNVKKKTTRQLEDLCTSNAYMLEAECIAFMKLVLEQGTCHAEMEAIDMLLEQWQKSGLTREQVELKFSKYILYVTCEPCIMCATALSIIGMKEVYYGCGNDKFGGCGSIVFVHTNSSVVEFQKKGVYVHLSSNGNRSHQSSKELL